MQSHIIFYAHVSSFNEYLGFNSNDAAMDRSVNYINTFHLEVLIPK